MSNNNECKKSRTEVRRNKEIKMYRGIRKSISYILIGVIAIGFTLNYTTTAKYTQAFDPAIQTITAAPWEVDSSIEHNGESVHEQIISNFKPGDIKTNLIKFTNNNDYGTTFYLEVMPTAYEADNNLFLNPNIELILKLNTEDGLAQVAEDGWQEVEGDLENRVYKYKIDIPAKTTVAYQMDIKWNSGENDTEYANKAGKINYKVIAEQIVEAQEDTETSGE